MTASPHQPEKQLDKLVTAEDELISCSAAEAELADAKGYKYNSFKIEMAKRAIVRALTTVAAIS